MDEDTRKSLFNGSGFNSVSGTKNEMGSGLGLTLVKDFVSQHGSVLKVESEKRKTFKLAIGTIRLSVF